MVTVETFFDCFTGLFVFLACLFFWPGEEAGFFRMLFKNHALAKLLGGGGVLLGLGDIGKNEGNELSSV